MADLRLVSRKDNVVIGECIGIRERKEGEWIHLKMNDSEAECWYCGQAEPTAWTDRPTYHGSTINSCKFKGKA